MTLGPSVAVSGRVDAIEIIGNAGLLLRSQADAINLNVGNDVQASVARRYDCRCAAKGATCEGVK
ncbi:MAG: hypothetical protein JKY56_22655 [Kofleriaceae bacterium]|nr:hypothetical protein [Kofleriaceae bacterium]